MEPTRKEIRTVSREVPIYACPHCGQECKGGGGLKAHTDAVHGDKPRGFVRLYKELKELREFKAQQEEKDGQEKSGNSNSLPHVPSEVRG